MSIVVPVINQSGVTVNCFHSIRQHTKIPYEVIWVDNHSKKEEYEIILRQAKLIPSCKVVRNKENLGFVKATNQGIKQSRGEYVVLLNNDTEVVPGWDMALLQPIQRGCCGAVGPLTNSRISWQTATYVNSRWHTSIPEFTLSGKKKYSSKLSYYKDKYLDITKEKINLAFFCVMIPRFILDKIGLLCEEFSIGLGDDDEYCSRLRSSGYKLYLSLGSFVMHYHRTTFNALGLGEDSLRKYNQKILKRKIAEHEALPRVVL